ncbi:MAG: DUF4384 domain-containing protein [bacterium]|nr:DUF4384 domain-containing protein [bacterium]
MAKKTRSKPSRAPARSKPHRLRKDLLILALVLAAVVLVYALFLRPSKEPAAVLADVFGPLADQGFTPNVGLSDLYQPGNVIQTRRAGADGEAHALPTPLPFLWAKDCFPGLDPIESRFVLPESSGTSSASLRLGAKALARLVPDLTLDDAAVASYSLELENTRIRTITSPQISRDFSPPCVDALQQARADGSPLEWFEVIVQAVVADAFRFEMEWRSESSAEARAALSNRAGKALSSGSGEVAVASNDEHRTLLRADGGVVLGYRTLSIEDPQEITSPPTGVLGRLTIQLRREDGSWQEVDVDHGFRTGDYFRFAITSSHDGWLYVLHRPPAGELGVLWPTAENDGRANAVHAQQTQVVPAAPEAFRFHGEVGREFFYVAIAAEPQAPAMESRENVKNFIVRGLARNVVIDRVRDAGASIAFSAPVEGGGTITAVQFQLRHAR